MSYKRNKVREDSLDSVNVGGEHYHADGLATSYLHYTCEHLRIVVAALQCRNCHYLHHIQLTIYRVTRPYHTMAEVQFLLHLLYLQAYKAFWDTNLRNGTEVEDRLVSDARQILNDVRYMSESVHYQLIQTCHGVLSLLGPRQIQQLVSVLAPHLAKHISVHFMSTAVTLGCVIIIHELNGNTSGPQ